MAADSAGTYNATSLKPSGTWARGRVVGIVHLRLPMAVPPAAVQAGAVAVAGLRLGSVDGQTAATQAQASWVGDGWSLAGSFIEQSFIPCADKPEGSRRRRGPTPDECYDGPVLSLSLDGASDPLVCRRPVQLHRRTARARRPMTTGEVVTHHVGSGNGQGTRVH